LPAQNIIKKTNSNNNNNNTDIKEINLQIKDLHFINFVRSPLETK